MKTMIKKTVFSVILLMFAVSALATNVRFFAIGSNDPVRMDRDIASNIITVRFNVKWDNSWNLRDPGNHDAIWVFMKYRKMGDPGFTHCYLKEQTEIVTGSGTTRFNHQYGKSNVVGLGERTVGVFFSPKDQGLGTTELNDVRLQWDITGTGIDEDMVVSVRVYAIEMVFVPDGQFHNQFPETAAESGWAAASANWPRGTGAFYVMKHEVTQAAWVDFLNSLTSQQQLRLSPINVATATAGAVFPPATSRMNVRVRKSQTANAPAVFGISLTGGSGDEHWDHENNGGNLPMFNLAWTDISAYLDWSGLRPMTEMEFVKAARGPLPFVLNEFAWGDATTGVRNTELENADKPNEVPKTANARFAHPTGTTVATAHSAAIAAHWPIRVGAFAGPETTRVQAGASFWGVMNMSDNVPERVITLHTADGRAFAGWNNAGHGDGNLTSLGFSNVATWPGQEAPLIHSTGAGAAFGAEGVAATTAIGTGYSGLNVLPGGNSLSAFVVANAQGLLGSSIDVRTRNDDNRRDLWTGFRGVRSATAAQPALTPYRISVQPNAGAVAMAPTGTNNLVVTWVEGTPPFQVQWYHTTSTTLNPLPQDRPAGTTAIPATGVAANLATRTHTFTPGTVNVLNNIVTGRYFVEITDATGMKLRSLISGAWTGTPQTFAYNGAVQTVTLTPGAFLIEVWGASGGGGQGGLGGYSHTRQQFQANQALNVVVGQGGAQSGNNAAVGRTFGGGAGTNANTTHAAGLPTSGGGASAIGISGQLAFAIAGGGGGGNSASGACHPCMGVGGNGGGGSVAGGNSTTWNASYAAVAQGGTAAGAGGAQTAGGSVGFAGGGTNANGGGTNNGLGGANCGSIGIGGGGASGGGMQYGTGGGGGGYGGGAGGANSASWGASGGGGGSGRVAASSGTLPASGGTTGGNGTRGNGRATITRL
jgi:formylglycine-generating enzyme required for sulfatase activity